jgi:hypothetical protein
MTPEARRTRSPRLYVAGLRESWLLVSLLVVLSVVGALLVLLTTVGESDYWVNVAAAPPFALLVVLVAEIPRGIRTSITNCELRSASVRRSAAVVLEVLKYHAERDEAMDTTSDLIVFSVLRQALGDMVTEARLLRAEFASMITVDVEAEIAQISTVLMEWRDCHLEGGQSDDVALAESVHTFLRTLGLKAPSRIAFPPVTEEIEELATEVEREDHTSPTLTD